MHRLREITEKHAYLDYSFARLEMDVTGYEMESEFKQCIPLCNTAAHLLQSPLSVDRCELACISMMTSSAPAPVAMRLWDRRNWAKKKRKGLYGN